MWTISPGAGPVDVWRSSPPASSLSRRRSLVLGPQIRIGESNLLFRYWPGGLCRLREFSRRTIAHVLVWLHRILCVPL